MGVPDSQGVACQTFLPSFHGLAQTGRFPHCKSWKGAGTPEAMQNILTSLGGLPTQPIDVPPLSLIANVQKTS